MIKNDSIVLNKLIGKAHAQSLNKKQHILSTELDYNYNYDVVDVAKSIYTTLDDYEFSKENLTFEWERLVFGIDKYGQGDVAYRVLAGPVIGNADAIQWFIEKKGKDDKLTLATPFGCGKFGDIEKVISLKDDIVTTNLYEFDKDTGWQREMAIIKKCRYEKGNIGEIKLE